MAVIKIKEDVFYVGANHWDRRLFDELIPLSEGTSYNSYIIFGKEKIALIDAVDPATVDQLLYNLEQLNVQKIDYVISNHAEQDHSGGIVNILEKFKDAKVVTNEKCKNMLMDLLLIPEDKFIVIKEKDTIDLGGKTLEFYLTPWVHWPETMVTYLKEDKVLFSCDFFGSHIATSDIFNDEHFYMPAKRYYAEIMSPFRNNVRNNLEKVKKLDIDIIAPSHGYIYKNPQKIISAYEDWASENVKNEVIIAYVSMHGSTKKMAEFLREELIKRNINVYFFNLTYTDIGQLAMALVDAATLIIAAPTVLAGVHPQAMYVAYLANLLRVKTKFIGIITSYGWGEKAVDSLKNVLTYIKPQFFTPVVSKGYPKQQEFLQLKNLADEILKLQKDIVK
ncbi:MAG: FprA family A-type flavoprotein [Elusimicrobiota bacterium]|nr:FprA family A-type flavoprotein [Elusimicrobiota bacterium]